MSDVPEAPVPEPPPPPIPGAREALSGATPPRDTVGTGVVRLLLLHLLQVPLSVVGGPIWIGLSQLFYVIPQHVVFKRQGRSACIRGLWIGAGVTFLLNAGCFGIVMMSLSSGSFR